MNIQELRNILEGVNDPDLGLSLRELNAIEDVSEVNGGYVVKLLLPGPTTYLNSDYWKILLKVLPSDVMDKLQIEITEDTSKLRKRNGKLSNIKHIISVASGKGGVGKSTIAANIAVELAAQGAKVGILDSDIYGPSQTIMFGVENEVMEAETDQHGRTIAYPVEKYGVKVASIGFVIGKERAAALRGPMLSQVFSMFYEQIEWGELDYLIFDLPPGTGDIHLTFIQKMQPDGSILVTTPQDISLADVRRGADLFKQMNVNILGIVENMSYFIPPDAPDKKYYIFGQDGAKKIAIELGLQMLGEVPFTIEMREDSDSGKPIVINENAGYQREVLRDITATMISQLRRKNMQ
ncbi:MAG: Mrp/NBP35 family ATP-binding protein [Ignavibacteria bacterium]|jgi:ATP-binding protein involved in chromosome partitioning|nr:Mrp/NBP35 family ATP-binding protein [Ignavibacteria bacterium]